MNLHMRLCLLLLPITSIVALKIPNLRVKNCLWNYNKDFPKNPPLILNEDGGAILPELVGNKRIFKVSKGEKLKMICAGEGNRFKKKVSKKQPQTFRVECLPDSLYDILYDTDNDKEYKMKDMGCKSPIKSSIQKTTDTNGNEECANDSGILYDIGFKDDEKMIYPLITICFNDDHKITPWAIHILHGKNIAANGKLQQSKKFTVSGFFKDVGMDLIYKKKSQRKLMEFVNSERRYLEKGHLAPKGDFITNADKIATYFYINSAPQWREINIGNWLVVEEQARYLTEEMKTDATIITAVFGSLINDDKPVYLAQSKEDNKDKKWVPVPGRFLKIVIVQNEDKSKSKAIAFIVMNNPYRTEVPSPDELPCKDVCDEINWLNDEERIDNFYKEMRNDLCFGYTICCEVNKEFREHKDLSFLPVTESYELLKDLKFD